MNCTEKSDIYHLDVAINSIVELNELMKNYLPGDTVKVGVKTNGEIKYADIVLDEKAKTE